ncbi:MAG TPA: tyrosine-type recombinase/integrase [Candidatus Babeliaceae bacterium]|nr:tyrosine-type recombinase/integrase [Candidatus Babeliaceae bacterium]
MVNIFKKFQKHVVTELSIIRDEEKLGNEIALLERIEKFKWDFETFSRPKFKESYREHLTVEEIQGLEKKYIYENDVESVKIVSAVRWYDKGLSKRAYTALRISDIIGIDLPSRIYGDNIIVSTQKDRDTVSIPMHAALRRLCDFIIKLDKRCYENQMCNRWLKVIMPAAGIKKYITFHCSRHTFAATFLELGGSLDALQVVLGHERT